VDSTYIFHAMSSRLHRVGHNSSCHIVIALNQSFSTKKKIVFEGHRLAGAF
jgi:hypothetical protein